MAHLISLLTNTDARGNLTVIEKIFPFDIKRIFYIYGVDSSVRGKHRHHLTRQAAICIKGSCRVSNQSGKGLPVQEFILDHPSVCLMIEPEDFHWMDQFSPDAILMVLASEYYDPKDYIFEPYE
ncbi:sugar 3,4-ketoisomerase [Phnomibacter ginsenosidimutans]|uniref:WxcM-like domain-containing protein n=1 Tax=Phnomibacter ginsenosidimutans TaxID=2676868 RepID=A0A6I6G4M6_9BACT|nr:FdtA/QdtA family cupin domain-containing protein [Phnomibacter ginsenosidimutans]QGW27027.1 WxcM-like domain-containing protein [Phnomibacter ginsenosidimutans]